MKTFLAVVGSVVVMLVLFALFKGKQPSAEKPKQAETPSTVENPQPVAAYSPPASPGGAAIDHADFLQMMQGGGGMAQRTAAADPLTAVLASNGSLQEKAVLTQLVIQAEQAQSAARAQEWAAMAPIFGNNPPTTPHVPDDSAQVADLQRQVDELKDKDYQRVASERDRFAEEAAAFKEENTQSTMNLFREVEAQRDHAVRRAELLESVERGRMYVQAAQWEQRYWETANRPGPLFRDPALQVMWEGDHCVHTVDGNLYHSTQLYHY